MNNPFPCPKCGSTSREKRLYLSRSGDQVWHSYEPECKRLKCSPCDAPFHSSIKYAKVPPLSIQGRAGDPIWLMVDGQEDFPIGMRLDCGDGGVVYLSTDQATELAQQLNSIVAELRK